MKEAGSLIEKFPPPTAVLYPGSIDIAVQFCLREIVSNRRNVGLVVANLCLLGRDLDKRVRVASASPGVAQRRDGWRIAP